MSEALETTRHAVIEAVMSWTTAGSPPDVALSFEGLDQPIGMLSDLGAIGWNVPVTPSRPSSAIEWTPDPVAGTEYTIRPWRVRQFQLVKRAWSPEVAAAIGPLTYDVLKRHGVQISGTKQMLDVLAERSAYEPAAEPQAQTHHAADAAPIAETPPGAPQVILISYKGDAIQGLRHLEGTTDGRKRSVVGWSESPFDLGTLCPDDASRAALFANATSAWSVQYTSAPPMPSGSGQAALCAVIPGMKIDDSKLIKFVSMLGGKVVLANLAPLDQRASESSALILGVVGASNAELISSNVRLRFRKAVVRIEQ